MPTKTTITVYKPSEKMPGKFETVITSNGVNYWDGEVWRRSDDFETAEPDWWHELTDPEEIASKLSPAPVKPEGDPFRIRSHRVLIEAVEKLLTELGVDEEGEFEVSCFCLLPHRTIFFRVDGRDIETDIANDEDPQLVFDEFERLMRQRFAPPEPVPAGLEACDGSSLTENGNG